MYPTHPKSVPGISRARLTAVVALAVILGGTLAAQCQSAMPAGSAGRFTMHPTDGGVLRLDTQTGALSMCKQESGAWACTLLPDDRAAMADEVTRLRSENTDLRASVRRLEDLAGVPPTPQPDGGDTRRRAGVQLPSEEDVDKAMSYVERMLKKFKDKLKELEGSDGRPTQRL